MNSPVTRYDDDDDDDYDLPEPIQNSSLGGKNKNNDDNNNNNIIKVRSRSPTEFFFSIYPEAINRQLILLNRYTRAPCKIIY